MKKPSILRKAASLCVRRIQHTSTYRKVMRCLCGDFEIKQADEKDMGKFRGSSSQNRMDISPWRECQVTNFAAKKGDTVVGFVQLVKRSEAGHPYAGYWLFGLSVKRIYRGIGIGKRLVELAVETARKEDAEKLSLVVDECNYRAINFYRKLGFGISSGPFTIEEQSKKETPSLGCKRLVMSKLFLLGQRRDVTEQNSD